MQLCEVDEAEEDGELHYQIEEHPDHGGMLFCKNDSVKLRTGGLRQNRLYLDTCSTSDLMSNQAFLSKIHKTKKALNLHTNAGTSRTTLKGYLGSIPFWCDPRGIASVISLRTLEKRFKQVKYNSNVRGGAFVVTTPSGEVVFNRCDVTGFPFVDLAEEGEELAVQLVQTVRKNYEGFTRAEVARAIRARKAQAAAGHPSEATMKAEVSHKSPHSLYNECPVTAKDITNAKAIFGPSLPCLKGKQVRTKPDRVDASYVSIPASIIERNKFLTLVADVMFVSGMPFISCDSVQKCPVCHCAICPS